MKRRPLRGQPAGGREGRPFGQFPSACGQVKAIGKATYASVPGGMEQPDGAKLVGTSSASECATGKPRLADCGLQGAKAELAVIGDTQDLDILTPCWNTEEGANALVNIGIADPDPLFADLMKKLPHIIFVHEKDDWKPYRAEDTSAYERASQLLEKVVEIVGARALGGFVTVLRSERGHWAALPVVEALQRILSSKSSEASSEDLYTLSALEDVTQSCLDLHSQSEMIPIGLAHIDCSLARGMAQQELRRRGLRTWTTEFPRQG